MYVVVFNINSCEIGFIVLYLYDICEIEMKIDIDMFCEWGVVGLMVIEEWMICFLNLYELVEVVYLEWFEDVCEFIEIVNVLIVNV